MGDEKGQPYTASEDGNQGDTKRVTCRAAFLNLLECQRSFVPAFKKEFCTTKCKDAYHRAASEIGQEAIKKMNTPHRQHFAKLENSPRLQRIIEVLSDGAWHSTLDIQIQACVCAVSTSMSEISRNGVKYETRMVAGHWEYRLLPKPVAMFHVLSG